MKKGLSLVTALATLVTVGGVYAGWSYAEGGVTGELEHMVENFKITDATTGLKSGTLDLASTLTLHIDDNGAYKPGWDSDVDNTSNSYYLSIAYKPNVGSDDVTLKYTLSIEAIDTSKSFNQYTYTDDEGVSQTVDILQITATDLPENVVLTGDFTVDASEHLADGSSHIETIKQKDIVAAVTVNDTFTLDTHAEYSKYAEAISNMQFVVTVEEVTE